MSQIDRIGGMGLRYLGMPNWASCGRYDDGEFFTEWSAAIKGETDDYNEHSLEAMLYILELFGLIEIIDISYPKGWLIFTASFRYTDEGAVEVIRNWNAIHKED